MLEEAEIPEEWKHDEAPPKKIQLAIKFGLVKLGYTLEDYLIHAVENQGYETVNVWGPQGSGKSSRMLQMGYWIYRDWNEVLNHIIFKPADFVKRLRSIPTGQRIPCLLWDDIGVHYTSSTFKTDIQQYQAIDSAWAAIRTKCNVIIMTIPLIDRLAKNIKDNITFEVFMGRNQMEMISRIFHLPGLQEIESNFFKVTVETPAKFNLFKVPKNIFRGYWKMRLQLTEEALEKLDSTVEAEDMEGFITAMDAAESLNKSANTIQQMASRGIIEGKKIKGRLCIALDDYERLLDMKEKRRNKK